MSNFVINSHNFEAPEAFDDQLKVYWKFNEASGNILNSSQSSDSLGTEAELSVSGGAYAQTGDPVNNSNMYFDGSAGTYATVTGTSLSQFNFLHEVDSAWTMAFWFKRNSGTDYDGLFDNTNNSNSNKGVMHRLRSSAMDKVQIMNGSAVVQELETGNDWLTTSWAFYVFTWDENGSPYNIIGRRDNANEVTNTIAQPCADGDSGNVARVASWADGSNPCDCNFSEFSIWNKVLSDEDQTYLYNSGSGRAIYPLP
jgi:hypothetical protein